MKNLIDYIYEKLDVKNIDAKNLKEKDPYDPRTWEVDDIVCCTVGYSMSLPRFYKITRKTPKGIVVKKMAGKIISGSRNGQWEEIADENAPLGDEFKGRIIQKGSYIHVNIDGHSVHLWNGKPLHGDDMD